MFAAMMPKEQQKRTASSVAASLAARATSGTTTNERSTNNATTGTIATSGSYSRVALSEHNEYNDNHDDHQNAVVDNDDYCENHDFAKTRSLPLKQQPFSAKTISKTTSEATTGKGTRKSAQQSTSTSPTTTNTICKSSKDAQQVSFASLPQPMRQQIVVGDKDGTTAAAAAAASYLKSSESGRVETERKQRNKDQVEEQVNYYYCCTSGENSRCNCSGRRRATLAGLIELFEQKLKVEDLDANGCDYHRKRATETTAKLINHNHSEQKISFKRHQQRQRQNKVNNMRNIITPVKYEQSDEEDGDALTATAATDEDLADAEQDSLDDDDDGDDNNNNQNNRQEELSTSRKINRLHHVAIKGVSVLPRPSNRFAHKLTRTNWQPATDGRQYETIVANSLSARNRHYNNNNNNNCIASDSNSRSNQRSETRNKTQGTSSKCLSSSPFVATRGPSIVKHQSSSSRRQLTQLAKLRRLKEPNYKVRRPEKVAEVEALIEQLERATTEWEEDELLLDRADRRDWPSEYYERFKKVSASTGILREPTVEKINFGRRADVNSLEEQAISESHSVCNLDPSQMDTIRFTSAGSWSASSTLNRRQRRSRAAFADRYFDDLAVRRLSRSPTILRSNSTTPDHFNSSQKQSARQAPQMSYLLCSNAYTPTIEDPNPYSPWDSSFEQQLRSDDLHYRGVKPKPDPFEPPFGIPRQNAVASSHSSASHYLRRPQPDHRPNSIQQVYSYCEQKKAPEAIHVQRKRIDPKVSFMGNSRANGGWASADSGVAAESPILNSGRISAASRPTPTSQLRSETPLSPANQADFGYVDDEDADNDDVAEEVDLDEELRRELDRCSSTCDSPAATALERYKAEFRNAPQRSRPKINIENPRAKSPLLRVASEPKSLSEQLECRIDFSDDEDDNKKAVGNSGPKFTIGQYKPMNKPNLKIL